MQAQKAKMHLKFNQFSTPRLWTGFRICFISQLGGKFAANWKTDEHCRSDKAAGN